MNRAGEYISNMTGMAAYQSFRPQCHLVRAGTDTILLKQALR